MILLKKIYLFTPKDSKRNVSVNFYCPDAIDKITILLSFLPDAVSDLNLCTPAIKEALAEYYDLYPPHLQPMKVEQFLPIKNLITLSLTHQNIYLGNAHRWNANQYHEITTEKASFGFNPPKTLTGDWTAILHLHEIFSLKCNVFLEIKGERNDLVSN